MNDDILAQVVSGTAKFNIQLDETTNVQSKPACCSHVLCERRHEKEYFLFSQPFITTTKAAEVKKLVDNFFKDNKLSWDMVSAIC